MNLNREDVLRRLWERKVESLHRMVDRMPTSIRKASTRYAVDLLEDRSLVTTTYSPHEDRMALLKDFHDLYSTINSFLRETN